MDVPNNDRGMPIQQLGSPAVAVLSRDSARAREFGAKVGVADEALCTSDFDVFAPAIDVVYIATPHTEHCQDALRCIRAGLHVLVEKPIALTADDGEPLREKCTARRVSCSHHTRHFREMRRIWILVLHYRM